MLKLNNISPLRYPGGKTKARKIIEKILLEHFNINDFDTLISPFFGGGSFEFYMQNKYGIKLIVNDKFTPLYNFWKQVKINKTVLCDKLKEISSISKDEFIDYRNANTGTFVDFYINFGDNKLSK
jgi:DNA adenine methylase